MSHTLNDTERQAVVSLITDVINMPKYRNHVVLQNLLDRLSSGAGIQQKLQYAPRDVNSYSQGYDSLPQDENPYVDDGTSIDHFCWDLGRAERRAEIRSQPGNRREAS